MCSQKILCRISLFTVILLLLRILLYATSTLKVLQFSTTYVDYYLNTTYYTTRKIHIFLHTHFCTFLHSYFTLVLLHGFSLTFLHTHFLQFLYRSYFIVRTTLFVLHFLFNSYTQILIHWIFTQYLHRYTSTRHLDKHIHIHTNVLHNNNHTIKFKIHSTYFCCRKNVNITYLTKKINNQIGYFW